MSVIQLMANAGYSKVVYDPWTDTIGTNTFTTTGTVTDVTTDPEHKSFNNNAYIDFSGGSTTADMRVRFRFWRDSGQTNYKAVYTRSTATDTKGSLWTQGGRFMTYVAGPIAGWNVLYTPTNMYNTWFWVDLWHSGTSMTIRIHDGGTETSMGSQLATATYTIAATGAYSTVRLMAGWSNATWAGGGDLGAVRYNVGATNTNWTSSFFPYKT